MNKLFSNRKAQTLDNFWALIQFFGFAVFLLIIWVVWANLTSSELDDALWSKTTVGISIKDNAQRAFDNWDWVAVMVYIGMHLGIILMAFLLRSHPIVYIAGIFLIVILVMVAAPMANAWEDITSDDDFTSALANLPKVDYILDNFPQFEMIWGFVTLIVLAGLAKGEGFI